MAYPQYCPYCKKGVLSVFDKTPMTAVLTCSDCDKLVTVKTGTGKFIEVAVPALSGLVSLFSLAAFFGISDFSKLKNWFAPSGK